MNHKREQVPKKEEKEKDPRTVCLRFRGEARGRGGWCYTAQGVYPASLTPSTVSVCQDRKDMAVIHRKSLGAAEWS